MHPALAWVAVIGIRRVRSQLIISVVLEPADLDALEGTEENDRGAHEYLGRVRVASGVQVVERWCGSQAALSELSILDDLPQFPLACVEAGPGIEIAVDLRIAYRDDDGAAISAADLAAVTATASPFPDELRVPLVARAGATSALHGPPFDEPAATDRAAVRSPALPWADASATVGPATPLATLPEVGILARTPSGAVLLSPGGERALPAFSPIERTPSYDLVCTAGPAGTLAVVWSDTNVGLQLAAFVPPDLARTQDLTRRSGQVFYPDEGRIDPAGRLLIVSVDVHEIAALDLAQGTFVWRRKLHADLHRLAIEVSTAAVVVAGQGELRVLDLATGAEQRRAWLPAPPFRSAIAVSASGRFAWTQTLAETPSPRGAVAWHDVGGDGGAVAIPDALLDARLVVLDDGRVLAAGESTWLVEVDGTVARIAPRLALPRRPLVTAGLVGHRLWTLDPACWFLDLPPGGPRHPKGGFSWSGV